MFAMQYLLSTAAFVGVALTLPAPVVHSDHHHGGNVRGIYLAVSDAHDQGKDHGHEDKAHFEAKTFGSAKEAWAFVTDKVAEVETLAADKNLEAIHEISEHLSAAVHTLKEKSAMVTGAPKTKLAAALKQLDKAVDELHHSTEENDADATSLNLKKVKGLLPLVHGLHPAGAL